MGTGVSLRPLNFDVTGMEFDEKHLEADLTAVLPQLSPS